MSFLVDSDAKAILVKTEWGRYRRDKSTTQINKKTGAEAMVWKREPFTGDPLTVSVKERNVWPIAAAARHGLRSHRAGEDSADSTGLGSHDLLRQHSLPSRNVGKMKHGCSNRSCG